MKEFQLHYIWHYKLLNPFTLYSVSHEKIEVISAGKPNKENGPDFQNALIKINGILWAGDVEIHVKASDWLKHNHNKDENYGNVILHVVWEDDKAIETHRGIQLCTLELKNKKILATSNTIFSLKEKTDELNCKSFLKDIPLKIINEWIIACGEHRMRKKIKTLKNIVPDLTSNHNRDFFILLGKYIVGKANDIQMQEMLEILPWKLIYQKRENLISILSILLLEAGLFEKTPVKIQNILKQEAEFLNKLYSSSPSHSVNWKTGSIMPMGKAEKRILQFGFMMYYYMNHSIFNITHQIFKSWTEDLKAKLAGYSLYNNSNELNELKRILIPGKEKLKIIYVNLLLPVINNKNNVDSENFCELKSLPAEKNFITRKFEKLGLKVATMLESQGLIEIYENFCKKNQCLNCTIGKNILQINSIT